MLWLFSPLVAFYCLLIDLLRQYVSPLFYHHPINLMLLEPRHCSVPQTEWKASARAAVRDR